MRQRIPFAGDSKDLDSRKSRNDMINCYFRGDTKGEYRDIVRAEALEPYIEVGDGPIRGMFTIRDSLFVVSGPKAYRVDTLDVEPFYEVTELGNNVLLSQPTDTRPVRINANGADINQVVFIASNGGFYNDNNTDGLIAISDSNFNPDISIASLNQRLIVNQPDSNRFQLSAIGDATTWDLAFIGDANQSPDNLQYIAAQRTNLWLMGSRTCEFWQSVSAAFPLRRVNDATIERGVLAPYSVAQFEDNIFWLADDLTVRQISGSSSRKISTLALEQALRGDGTPRQTGYPNPAAAEGFFVDLPSRKYYVLAFEDEGISWVYDLSVGLWHKRLTNDTTWRAKESAKFPERLFLGGSTQVVTRDTTLVGSRTENIIYKVNEGTNGLLDKVQIITPQISGKEGGLWITEVELVCEVGVGPNDNSLPEIVVEFSKDGGLTWNSVTHVSIGRVGEKEIRVISRQFGHIKRHFEFVLRYTLSDNVYFKAYELWADIEEGV